MERAGPRDRLAQTPRSYIPVSLKSLNPQSSIQCSRQKLIKCLKEPRVARAPTRPAQCAQAPP